MKSSVDTFLLYFDGKMIQTIVDHTNIESVREKGNGRTLTQWNEIIHWMFATYGAPLQNEISVEVLFTLSSQSPSFCTGSFFIEQIQQPPQLSEVYLMIKPRDLHGGKEVYFVPSVTCGMPSTQN